MSIQRRIILLVGVGLALCSLALAIGWLVWLPSEVEERVRDAAARRGLIATIEGVSLGFSSVDLEGLEVRANNGGLRARLEEVSVGAGVIALATDGTAAAQRIEVHGARVQIDLAEPGLVRALETLRGERDENETAATPERGRELSVQDLALEVRDHQGVLATIDGAEAHYHEGFEVSLPTVTIGESREGATLRDARLSLSRDDAGAWQLARAELGEAALHYPERGEDEPEQLWERIRRHAALFSDDQDDAERDPADAEPADAEPADAEPTDPPPAEQEPPTSGPLADIAGRLLVLTRGRVAPGARASVRRLSVSLSTEDGERPVLRELEAEVSRLDDDGYHLEGSGRPGRGGRLGWDMTVYPETLRAEGSLDFQRVPFVLVVPFLPTLPWHQPEDARLSGAVEIQGDGPSRIHVEGTAAIEDLALSSPRVAPEPVRRIAAAVEGEADWNPLQRRLEVPRAQLTMGAATAHLRGAIEMPAEYLAVDLRATLPPTDCNDAVGAIPPDLLADLAAFTYSGQIGGRAVVSLDTRDLDATTLDIDIADACVFHTAPALADVTRFDGPFVHRVLEPDGTSFEMETGPGTLGWTPIGQMSPFFIHAVLGHEDGGFFRHSGFATHAIRLALIRNVRAGRYVYGASTITMQLVKNVFLHREKTLARKLQEVLLTWWVEHVMDKRRILELYLNVIEYGPDVYGIRAAAHHYFGRPPADLGPAESAYLATILPNPPRFHSHYESDHIPDSHRRRVARFLRTLGSRGRYDTAAVERGIEELASLVFYRPGQPLPPRVEDDEDEPPRGGTRELPFGTSVAGATWDDPDGPFDDADADADGWEEY